MNQGLYFSMRGTHLQSCPSLSFCNIVWLLWDTCHCVTVTCVRAVSPSDRGPLRAELCLLVFSSLTPAP